MRVDTIELLRCPAEHEAAPLVTVADTRIGERLMSGTLGCPVCGAEYAMQDGIVYLTARDAVGVGTRPVRDILPVDAMRIAALLGLTEPRLRVMLCGIQAAAADEIERVTGAHCIAVNGEASLADQLVIAVERTLPIANASLHGLALDAAHAVLVNEATRVVRVGGRVTAPVSMPMPRGLRELARDEHEWVAQVDAVLAVSVQLRRG